jgi:hypothetical protein
MRLLFALAVFVLSTASAQAQLITRCGASAGYSYFFENRLAPGQSGWQRDGISTGNLQLIKSGDEYDIVYQDTVGARSARADGFKFVHVTPSAGFLMLIGVSNVGVLDHYLFRLDTHGRGEVLWGTSRGTGLIPKATMMRAECTGR